MLCYEMRTYHSPPGKFDDLHARFRDHTCKLFARHGINIIGFWVPTSKELTDTLVYLLSYPSRDAADASWNAFREDPDWISAKEASELAGPIVDKVESVFMDPTDYSPLQ